MRPGGVQLDSGLGVGSARRLPTARYAAGPGAEPLESQLGDPACQGAPAANSGRRRRTATEPATQLREACLGARRGLCATQPDSAIHRGTGCGSIPGRSNARHQPPARYDSGKGACLVGDVVSSRALEALAARASDRAEGSGTSPLCGLGEPLASVIVITVRRSPMCLRGSRREDGRLNEHPGLGHGGRRTATAHASQRQEARLEARRGQRDTTRQRTTPWD